MTDEKVGHDLTTGDAAFDAAFAAERGARKLVELLAKIECIECIECAPIKISVEGKLHGMHRVKLVIKPGRARDAFIEFAAILHADAKANASEQMTSRVAELDGEDQ